MTMLEPAGLGEVPSLPKTDVGEDEATSDQHQALEVKLVELRESNHKLRVENVALRRRIDQLKSNLSFQSKVLVTFLLLGILFGFLISYVAILVVRY
jgi:hypothetical protein